MRCRVLCSSLFWVVQIGLGPGCVSWNHAPGYEALDTMTRVSFEPVEYSACGTAGACDMRSGDEQVLFSEVSLRDSVGPRSLRIDYLGATALCLGPTTAEASGGAIPYACNITSSDSRSAPVRVEMDYGCLSGSAVAKGGPGQEEFKLHADVVEVDGVKMPGREISILDDRGVLAIADLPGAGSMDLYLRRGSKLAPELLLALVALGGYAQALPPYYTADTPFGPRSEFLCVQ